MRDESVVGIFKAGLHRNSSVLADNDVHWRGLEDLKIATCAGALWFNEERLHGEFDYLTPSEIEEGYRVKHQTRAA